MTIGVQELKGLLLKVSRGGSKVSCKLASGFKVVGKQNNSTRSQPHRRVNPQKRAIHRGLHGDVVKIAINHSWNHFTPHCLATKNQKDFCSFDPIFSVKALNLKPQTICGLWKAKGANFTKSKKMPKNKNDHCSRLHFNYQIKYICLTLSFLLGSSALLFCVTAGLSVDIKGGNFWSCLGNSKKLMYHPVVEHQWNIESKEAHFEKEP